MGGSQTASLASLPKIIKNYESHTAITSIVICDSKSALISPSLRVLAKGKGEAIQKNHCRFLVSSAESISFSAKSPAHL
ncbi:hypothetical protein ACWIUD_01910 [Helicobacter sp. 23-1044]